VLIHVLSGPPGVASPVYRRPPRIGGPARRVVEDTSSKARSIDPDLQVQLSPPVARRYAGPGSAFTRAIFVAALCLE
jgi:hypothetical protein